MDILTQLFGLDESLFRAINVAGMSHPLDVLMILFTLLGEVYILPLLSIWLWIRGSKKLAIDLLFAILIATVLAEGIEYITGRLRPFEFLTDAKTISFYGLTSAPGYSFPSGHAARIFAAACLVCFGRRWQIWAPSLAVATLTGVSRVYLGLHWPSDIAVGAAVGFLIALALHKMGTRAGRYDDLRAKIILLVDRLIARFKSRLDLNQCARNTRRRHGRRSRISSDC